MKSTILANKYDMLYTNKDGIEYIQFNSLLRHNEIAKHCFTTRKGGVSSGEFDSLNFGMSVEDSIKNVFTNYEILSKALGIDYKNMVLSQQIHDNKIRVVTKEDRGLGIVKENALSGYDGLVTNEKDVILVAFFADCVPVFFLDPIKKVVGIVHSGWKGTLKEVSVKMLDTMKSKYECDFKDLEIVIGPSIGDCCFEVGDEVFDKFQEKFRYVKSAYRKIGQKWHINVQEIIKTNLLDNGVSQEKLSVLGLCTKCNNDIFYSHRGDHQKTGRMIGMIYLK